MPRTPPILMPIQLLMMLAAWFVPDTRVRAQGGERIEILHADAWSFDQQLAPGAQRITGNVSFRHEKAVMHCDSAHLFEDQTVNAFGHIDIRQGDTLHMTGDRLHYDGKTRLARLDGRVRLNDPGMTLETEHLSYDLRSRQATYTEGGKLTSKRDGGILVSDRGTYHSNNSLFVFSGKVHLTHPDHEILSDTLHYTTTTGLAAFHGPTELTAQGTRMWCTRGTYDTRGQFADLTRDAMVLTGSQRLRGDTLRFDQIAAIGMAYGHVQVLDSTNGLVVTGARGRHDQRTDGTWITGRAELRMALGADTLYLHGDTLFAEAVPRSPTNDTMDAPTTRRITARRGARFFKSDLQGVCDTLVYEEADSTIHLLHRPALWSGNDQITGDRITLTLMNGSPYRLFVNGNGFIASQVDSSRYDQVTGTTITGYFDHGRLDHMLAQGTCRTVYYAREGPPEAERLIGMNRADCSKIRVAVHEGTVNEITFLTKPEAVLYPMEQVPPEESLLRGFVWRAKERPLERDAIFP